MDRLDIVIFGATGFTGKYVVEELVRLLPEYPNLTWGIAGRSRKKLTEVLKETGLKAGVNLEDIPVIIADVTDTGSLLLMASASKVLLNCCGPFRLYGEPVVRACILSRTHHLDVTGEPYFMESMQLKYDQDAREAGVYVVSACGFDCIPNDLGAIFLESKFKGTVNSIESYLSFKVPPEIETGALFHYATFESAIYGFANKNELTLLRKKLFHEKIPPLSPKLRSRPTIHQNKNDGLWYIPFMGADPSVLHRTQRYFMATKNKRPIQIRVYFGFESLSTVLRIVIWAFFFMMAVHYQSIRELMLKHPKEFTMGAATHEGPNEETMENTSFSVILKGTGWDESVSNIDNVPPNKLITVKVSGYNPSYRMTGKTLVLCGITILEERHRMPESGGVLTTAAAFSETSLIDNLHNHGVKFEVLPNDIPNARL